MNVNPFSKIQMVDDKANRFLPTSNMSWISSANLNDDTYKESGLYCIGSGSSNSPGNWGILTVLKPRNDAIIQYYALNNVMYHRDYTGGSWQSWKTFADTSDFDFGAKQSITPSSYTSWGEYGHCYYRTRGKEVELNISLSGASGANGVTITTLPSACRPSHNKGFACVSVDGGGVAEGAIYVLADGKVNITSAKTYFIANIKYTAD